VRPRRRCGAHRACSGAPGGNPVPCRVLCATALSWLLMRSLGTAQRSVPTLNVVREILGRSTSSSSSHVWKLGTGPLSAGQVPTSPVGPLWAVSVLLLSTRGQLDRRAQRPPFVHLHSPGCPLFVPMPCARRPARPPCCRLLDAVHRGKVQVTGVIGADVASAGLRGSANADRHRDGSPQPVHIPGDNFSTCRPDRRSLTSLCRAGTGLPLSTGLHTTVDSDMSTWFRRRSDGLVGGAQPDAPDDLARVLRQPPSPSTARSATAPGGRPTRPGSRQTDR
jgi:hypothetical protein